MEENQNRKDQRHHMRQDDNEFSDESKHDENKSVSDQFDEKDARKEPEYKISMPSENGPFVTFTEFSHHQSPEIPISFVNSSYEKYKRHYFKNYCQQFCDLNSNKTWFKSRYSSEGVTEAGILRKSLLLKRHEFFKDLIQKNLDYFQNFSNFDVDEAIFQNKPASIDPTHAHFKLGEFCNSLHGISLLIQSKTELTAADLNDELSKNLELLNLYSLFPNLNSRLIYKFIVSIKSDDFEQKLDANFLSKVTLKRHENKAHKLAYFPLKTDLDISTLLKSMKETYRRLFQNELLPDSDWSSEVKTFSDKQQVLVYIIYFFYVWYLNTLTGEFSLNNLEFYKKTGDFPILQLSSTNFQETNEQMELEKETKMQSFFKSWNFEKPEDSIKAKVDEKMKSKIKEVSKDIFMCEICKKFFESSAYTWNHITHRHPDKQAKYFERYSAKFSNGVVLEDRFFEVFTKIETMKIHFQPNLKTFEGFQANKRIKENLNRWEIPKNGN